MEPALASQRVLVGEEVAGSAVGVSLLTQLHQTSCPRPCPILHPQPSSQTGSNEAATWGSGGWTRHRAPPLPRAHAPPLLKCGRRSGGRGAGAGLQAWVRQVCGSLVLGPELVWAALHLMGSAPRARAPDPWTDTPLRRRKAGVPCNNCSRGEEALHHAC